MSQSYQVLFNSQGIVDALRFIQYLNPGQGDYTQERQQWQAEASLEAILSTMRDDQTDDTTQYDKS
ncbi:MAG: hypothetical protein AAGF24_04720 [Cyanobacteria bacterium P01_H01_bin.121]